MNPTTHNRLFGIHEALDHPVTRTIVIGLICILIATPWLIRELKRRNRINDKLSQELYQRYYSWLILIPMMLVPILLGAACTILGIGLLSLLCYREYARATGLFREKLVSFVIVVGIIFIHAAVLDHWYGLFAALTPLTVSMIAAVAILSDRPAGYIQRVALGVLGFLLFGASFGHLAYIANDTNYRPLLLLILVAVELNDVFAFIVGKTFGRHKLAPNTSPNKTMEGSIGALLLTMLLVYLIGSNIYSESYRMEHGITQGMTIRYLLLLGAIIGIVGQLGDLMLSSIKRDLGIKDFGNVIPGHGGLLDRFDSLILVSPAVFHFLNYVVGIGRDQPMLIFTGGW